jgi:hypothetical protein
MEAATYFQRPMVLPAVMVMAALKQILVKMEFALDSIQRHVLLQINAMLLGFAIQALETVQTQFKLV